MRAKLSAALVPLLASVGVAISAPQAGAVNVYHCNTWWLGGTECPNQPLGARHTYKSGSGASDAAPGTMIQRWYVAYTNSNGSSPKYSNSTAIGFVLVMNFPNNTQLLRGYSIQTPYNGNLTGFGSY